MTRPQHLDLSSKLTHLAFHPRSLPTEKPQTSHVTPARDQTGHGEQLPFFGYLASRVPEMLDVGQRVAAIPTKRAAPPETRYLERDEITTLFARLPTRGRRALRDRVLLLTLYNTGARVQEIADLRVQHLDLRGPAHIRLHGKGDKWR